MLIRTAQAPVFLRDRAVMAAMAFVALAYMTFMALMAFMTFVLPAAVLAAIAFCCFALHAAMAFVAMVSFAAFLPRFHFRAAFALLSASTAFTFALPLASINTHFICLLFLELVYSMKKS